MGTLSGGQRQALTLLMATLQKPKLLLLDEHTAALDPQTAQRVMDITDRLVRENHLTTLMITHNMRDAIHYGNRLLMLHNGRIVLVALLLAGILLVMGAYRLFSWLCSRGLTDTLTWVLGAAALVLAALGLLLASRSFRRLKELHL